MGLFSKPEPEEVVILGNPMKCEICTTTGFLPRGVGLGPAAELTRNGQ